ncbi:MAG: hypothetical protein U0934_11575 [Pseudotabrizicola sp.]|uniref:hypothetical protein n=1 Tax=Pseudotabrizicola sp. TaxID=2939647 RepID=UPI0027300879|nr:hypothetical protein [Pseudotabrizicola sp.]MDP2079658.1 hypothetical protein [Pseudotabrizicola sp.]MDZ7574579.1 hypothetical protein [Pseudotabrizicola sp.]
MNFLTVARTKRYQLTAPFDNIDDLRSQIVTHLVTALEVYIPLNEARVAQMAGIETLDTWANYHLGLQHPYRFTAEDNLRAKGCFERAVTRWTHNSSTPMPGCRSPALSRLSFSLAQIFQRPRDAMPSADWNWTRCTRSRISPLGVPSV